MLKYCYLTLALLCLPAMAEEQYDPPEKTIREVVELLIAQDFHDISKVEFDADDNHYEIKARNARDEKVHIEMTPSGQFITIESD